MTSMQVRRTAYLVAAAATLVSGVTGLGGFVALTSAGGFHIFHDIGAVAILPIAVGAGAIIAIAATFIYLARTRQPWGKLICLVGLPWIGFSAVSGLMKSDLPAFPLAPLLAVPGVCGAVLFIVFVVLLVADRGRLFGASPM